jgi:hypothetical protein
MADNIELLTLLGNLGNVDASGCPAPFIGEALHPYKGGCEWTLEFPVNNRIDECID